MFLCGVSAEGKVQLSWPAAYNAGGSLIYAKGNIMSYQMEIDTRKLTVPGSFFTDQIAEHHSNITGQGFSMSLHDISSPDLHLTWGNHRADAAQNLSVQFDTPAMVSHFCLADSSRPSSGKYTSLEKSFSLYYQEARVYDHELHATAKEQGYVFFELALSPSFLERFSVEEAGFADIFRPGQYMDGDAGVTYRAMTPAMLTRISEMGRNAYQGAWKSLYLEAKATELFLLQLQALGTHTAKPATGLKPADIACLHEARQYIDQHFHTPCSIIDLARKVGINQMKLKNGFRQLFGTTVFGYLRDLQMEKAKQLLLEEKLYVNEVAERVGYSHPHHFSVAFKRKFGILPSALKR